MARRPRPTIRQIVERYLALFIPEISKAFIASIRGVTDNAVLQQLVDNIERGDIDGAFRGLGFNDAAMRPLTATIERAYEQGGIMTGETFPRFINTTNGKTIYRFDVRNSRAEKWIREESSGLVTRVVEDTRVGIRNVLTDGMTAGRNPRQTALDIIGRLNTTTGRREGGIIGLTVGQERWVARTRRQLVELDPAYFQRKLRDKRFDSVVQRAIKDGKPLSPDIINKLVGRYNDNALRYRGETIARTESIQALNASEHEAIKQAVETGAVKPEHVRRIWDSAGDDRVRDSHAEMDGQSVGLDEAFKTPRGAALMFPGDSTMGAPADEVINCRCRVRMAVDWLADLD